MESIYPQRSSSLTSRAVAAGWVVFGYLAQVAFAVLVPCLFLFMVSWASRLPEPDAVPLAVRAGLWPATGGVGTAGMAGLTWWLDGVVDLLLVAGFGLPHSLLLLPPVRKWMARYMPAPLVGCLFGLVSCATLFLCFLLWRPLPGVIWALEGPAALVMMGLYFLAWVGLYRSIQLTGLGYQTGWSPFRYYLRQEKEPRREFVTAGAYRYLRHPIYLSFLLISWLTPVMSTAHLLLSLGLTVYIYVGSVLKDRRLEHYIGESYREYARRVPGYPFIPWGPLARWKR